VLYGAVSSHIMGIDQLVFRMPEQLSEIISNNIFIFFNYVSRFELLYNWPEMSSNSYCLFTLV